MRRDDVPDGYRPVQCTRCLDWLAVPLDVTAEDIDTILRQHAEMRHKTPQDWPSEVRFMLEQLPGHDIETYCPNSTRGELGHCGHWHYGALLRMRDSAAGHPTLPGTARQQPPCHRRADPCPRVHPRHARRPSPRPSP